MGLIQGFTFLGRVPRGSKVHQKKKYYLEASLLSSLDNRPHLRRPLDWRFAGARGATLPLREACHGQFLDLMFVA